MCVSSKVRGQMSKTSVYKIAHRPETGGKESTKEMQEERRKDTGGALGICLDVLVVLRGGRERKKRSADLRQLCDAAKPLER